MITAPTFSSRRRATALVVVGILAITFWLVATVAASHPASALTTCYPCTGSTTTTTPPSSGQERNPGAYQPPPSASAPSESATTTTTISAAPGQPSARPGSSAGTGSSGQQTLSSPPPTAAGSTGPGSPPSSTSGPTPSDGAPTPTDGSATLTSEPTPATSVPTSIPTSIPTTAPTALPAPPGGASPAASTLVRASHAIPAWWPWLVPGVVLVGALIWFVPRRSRLGWPLNGRAGRVLVTTALLGGGAAAALGFHGVIAHADPVCEAAQEDHAAVSIVNDHFFVLDGGNYGLELNGSGWCPDRKLDVFPHGVAHSDQNGNFHAWAVYTAAEAAEKCSGMTLAEPYGRVTFSATADPQTQKTVIASVRRPICIVGMDAPPQGDQQCVDSYVPPGWFTDSNSKEVCQPAN